MQINPIHFAEIVSAMTVAGVKAWEYFVEPILVKVYNKVKSFFVKATVKANAPTTTNSAQ